MLRHTTELNRSTVGQTAEPVIRTWSDADAMLYSLSIGFGSEDFTEDLQFTTENTPGAGPLVVPPTFATVAGRNQEAEWLVYGPAPGTTLLASEDITVHRPLPAEGRVEVTTRVADLFDLGKHALLVMASTAVDVDTQTPMFTRDWSVILREEGGWGGRKPPPVPTVPQDKEPDFVRSMTINPLSALLYRLIDSRSPIHSDPELALVSGFPAPIMHGRGTLGYALQMLTRGPVRDVRDIVSFGAHFRTAVVPGATVTLHAWWESERQLSFSLIAEDGRQTLAGGRCTLRGRSPLER